jgi:HEAT repeat protein
MKDCYAGRDEADLLQGLGSWSPTVRYRSASSLAKAPGDVVPALVRMLESDSLDARYGACQALEYQGERAAPAVDALIRLLAHRDAWLRIRAGYALAGIGAPARRAVPALLHLALAETDDPRRITPRYLCLALFLGGYADNAPRRGLLADSVDGVDRGLLIPALERMLTLDDGLARSQIASVYGRLTDGDLQRLWPAILRAVETPAPSGEMFADGIRVAGLQLLARHHMTEGVRAAVAYARTQTPWASQDRMWEIMAALKTYGAAAKVVLPELRDLRTACVNEKDFPDDCKQKKTAAVDDAIRAIESATEQPPLRSVTGTLPKPE